MEPYDLIVADIDGVPGQKRLDELPDEAKYELASLFAVLMFDPWGLSRRYSPTQVEAWRTASFGDRGGLLKFLINDTARRIVVTSITWVEF